MARIKIELPDKFSFTTIIPIRITDVNYGGHVGNDTILTIMHEARMQFLSDMGYKELEFEGLGMIMADAGIEFKNELFYGESVIASISVADITKVSFDIYYKLEKTVDSGKLIVAIGKTGMVCYDYSKKRIAAIPEKAINKLAGG